MPDATPQPDLTGQTAALIPVRSLTTGKTRLAPEVDPARRGHLIREMLGGVVAATHDSGAVDRVAVISPDPDVLAHAADLLPGLIALRQTDDHPGLLGALDQGRAELVAGGAAAVLVLFADLPMITGEDVRAIVTADAPVVLSPDRHAEGTNALLLRGPALVAGDGPSSRRPAPFRYRFGIASFPAHLAEADRLGLPARTVVTAGTSLDVDTPADLREWADRATPPPDPGPVPGGEWHEVPPASASVAGR